jgi:hypothetical protein
MITIQMVVAVENAEPVNLERPKFHPVTNLLGGTCSTYDSTWRIMLTLPLPAIATAMPDIYVPV